MSSPRRPGSSRPAARSAGFRRASGGGVPPPRCSSASWSITPSPPASAGSSPRITRPLWPSSGSWPRSRPVPAGTRWARARGGGGPRGHRVGAVTWERLTALADSAAALVDERSQPPRQGDSDEGRGLLLDAPVANRWPAVFALGEALVGRLDWWPPSPAGVESTLAGALASGTPDIPGRPARRPDRFADAGITLLRSDPAEGPAIWCRCDGGPHGFLSIAPHAHADALSGGVRYGGVDILADPGTYCYHGDPPWRS